VSSTKKIFLVGMPGSGKSTLGRILAEQLAISFYDLDTEIEDIQGRSITDIFSNEGEEVFRRIEAATLLKIIDQNVDFVMATGGGTPCFYDGMKVMQRSGSTIYLDTPLEVLVARTKKKLHRPLLGDHPEGKIKEIFTAREECYAQANFRLDTAGLDRSDKAEKIVAYLSQHQ
jgi:shikimate kinase